MLIPRIRGYEFKLFAPWLYIRPTYFMIITPFGTQVISYPPIYFIPAFLIILLICICCIYFFVCRPHGGCCCCCRKYLCPCLCRCNKNNETKVKTNINYC